VPTHGRGRVGVWAAALALAIASATGSVAAVAETEAEAEWPLHGLDWREQRHSPLTQIRRDNLSELGLAWSYATGTRRGLEATPIVVDGVLYATGTWSVVYALDAATGRERWIYDPKVPRQKGRDACCDVVNRGVAVADGRVYVGTIGGHLIALDASTGEEIWKTLTVDPAEPYTITGAPRVVKDLVIIGNGGADLGVRGYFGAYETKTGKLRWRFYTVPASKEGPFEHPELALAAETWPKESMWESGLGGTVWDGLAYDPEADLLYVGVGNSSVYDRTKRSPGGGDNLFLTSILAVKPDTGRLVWHYQTVPAESWDYTATAPMILADLKVDGRVRKVLMQAPKNGFFYVLDRISGELLSAEKYVDVSWATHVDMKTGRPVERAEADWSQERAYVSPPPPGGHNWHPMTFSPRTGLVYIPTFSGVHPFTPNPSYAFKPGHWNTAENLGAIAEALEEFAFAIEFCDPSHITAWDPIAARQVWRVNSTSGVPAGLLSTASDLLFQGRADGRFLAFDARTGEQLWSTSTQVGVMAPPISYQVAGEQFVAVLAGLGGSHGGHYLKLENGNDGRILAYKLGGKENVPPAEPPRSTQVHRPELDLTPAKIDRGRELYHEQCFYCHGMGAVGSGLHPDLRFVSRAVHESWNDIVLGGTKQSKGMASYADRLDVADSEAIHAYVVQRAVKDPDPLAKLAHWAGQYLCMPSSWMTD